MNGPLYTIQFDYTSKMNAYDRGISTLVTHTLEFHDTIIAGNPRRVSMPWCKVD